MLQIYKNKANNSLYYILLTIRPPFLTRRIKNPATLDVVQQKIPTFSLFSKPLIINQMRLYCRFKVIKTARFIQFFEVPQAPK
jgi:hypothetical protein